MTTNHLTQLHDLQMQIQKRLDKRPIEDEYCTAWRLGACSQFDEEVLEKASKALRFNTVSWLIENGYELKDVPQLLTESFDYGYDSAVAIKIEAIKEKREFPIAVRMLLMLLRTNNKLASRNKYLTRRIVEQESPTAWAIFKLFVRKLFGLSSAPKNN